MLEQKALFYYNNGTYSEAIRYFDQLIHLDSTKGEYYFKRGYSYGKQFDQFEEFINYEKAIELNYDVADANFNIATIAFTNDQDSIAIVYLDKSLKAGSTKYKDIQLLKKMCIQNLALQKTDAWKEFQEYKKRTKQN